MDYKYLVVIEYPGVDDTYDAKIRSVVDRYRNEGGSGYSIQSGCRDLCFFFVKKGAAKNAARRVRQMKPKRRGTKVHIINAE